MKVSTERMLIRWFHIIASIPVVGYIYGPVSQNPHAVTAVRYVIFPAIVLSGLWLWKGRAIRNFKITSGNNTNKMKTYSLHVLWLLVIALGSFQSSPNGNLKLVVTGIKNSNGEININVFNRADGFPKEDTKAIRHLRGRVSDGKCTVVITGLPFGKYAIAVYHDENNDKKLNKSWYGIPSEGVGSSNNVKGNFGPPTFDQAKFDFGPESNELSIVVHYGFKK
jgi:uncharacterized protein (DUF2141 family)